MVPVVKTAGTILFSNQALGQARRRGYNARVDLAQDHNRRVWDERVQQGRLHTRTARDKEFENPLKAINGRGWITGGLEGKQVLCLAGGGGLQAPLYAAAGAVVTVVDISPEMIEQDKRVAKERGLKLTALVGSMDDLSMLANASFDLVSQPVSTCYVPNLAKVYDEIARVLRVGGQYLSQHKQPTNLQAAPTPFPSGYAVTQSYYDKGPLPPLQGDFEHREKGALEFVHRWEELIGGLCRAGFVIEDLAEPNHGNAGAEPGSFRHRSHYVPPYVAIKARRVDMPALGQARATGILSP